MVAARGLLRLVRLAFQRARFDIWVGRAKLEARRRGTRLVVEAPFGARFQTMPVFHLTPQSRSASVRPGRPREVRLRIGENVDLGRGTLIEFRAEGHNVLELRDHVYFLSGVRIALFDGSIVVGGQTRVRDNALLKSSGDLRIGERVTVGYGAALHCADEIVLEDMVAMAERVSLVDSDHVHDGSDVYNQDQPVARSPIRLRRNSLVGANSVILRGVDLGANSVVAAGAVVRGGRYPEGWMIGGVPAKAIRPLGADGRPDGSSTKSPTRA